MNTKYSFFCFVKGLSDLNHVWYPYYNVRLPIWEPYLKSNDIMICYYYNMPVKVIVDDFYMDRYSYLLRALHEIK